MTVFVGVLHLIRERLIERVHRLIIPRIEDIMSKPIVTVKTNTSVMDAIRLMYNKRIGSVIVTKEDSPVGIFTHRDLMGRVLMKNASLVETKVGDMMSSPVSTVKKTDSVIKAVEIMKTNRVTRVIVLDDLKPVGVLTKTDVNLKVSKGSLSYSLAFKKFVVDTFAQIVFWSWISLFIRLYILGIPLEKVVAESVLTFIATLLLEGLFGRFLDWVRARFEVD